MRKHARAGREEKPDKLEKEPQPGGGGAVPRLVGLVWAGHVQPVDSGSHVCEGSRVGGKVGVKARQFVIKRSDVIIIVSLWILYLPMC